MADTVTVAEIENPSLWQRIPGEIHGRGSSVAEQLLEPVLDTPEVGSDPQCAATTIGRFSQLPIDRTQKEGVIAPRAEAPYLTLDVHCWEKMKQQVAGRGSTIPALAVAATLLVLWRREAGLETPSQSQAQSALKTLDIEDKNASRAIRNAGWLHSRPGGQILINPAQNSKALLVAKCFCKGDWSEWKKEQPVGRTN